MLSFLHQLCIGRENGERILELRRPFFRWGFGYVVNCKGGHINGWTWLVDFLWLWGNFTGPDYVLEFPPKALD